MSAFAPPSRRNSDASECELLSLTSARRSATHSPTGRSLVECSSPPLFKERLSYPECSPTDDATPASPCPLKVSTSAVSLVTGECGLSSDGSSSDASMRGMHFYDHDRLLSKRAAPVMPLREVVVATPISQGGGWQRLPLPLLLTNTDDECFCSADAQPVLPPRTDAQDARPDEMVVAAAAPPPPQQPQAPPLSAKEVADADAWGLRGERSRAYFQYISRLFTVHNGSGAVDRTVEADTSLVPATPNMGTTHKYQL
ncbi:hypothetical protein STCU_10242 [Strigomonas culicis]|uniref:Uncharacterized protein n=1 Tax=Strigomonas culicis TaxID=28005 RepID=S9UU07_9TRYP|nr:hypothetical protein STCU_10242 [Strigomonas culicis]|eukprot:EPY18026.1 hypothetical protein STCU_10242 [Strigomonas culicis]